MFTKYTDNVRQNGGSQSEKSSITINNNIFRMNGYHIYDYDKTLVNPVILLNQKQITQLDYLSKIDFKENSTLIDLGCANGAISIYLNFIKNFSKIILLDHDKEYINNLNVLVECDNRLKNKIITINSEFGKYPEQHDYVMILSLIH